MEIINMWNSVAGECQTEPILEYYPTTIINNSPKTAVVIFPGGAYRGRAVYEGQGYAHFFNSLGIDAFVCQYRVCPHSYPLSLLDARRAVQYIRYNCEKLDINPEKIGVIGSSAGGHLIASLCNIYDDFSDYFVKKDEIDETEYMPNFHILCYPVITFKDFGHQGSKENLLGDKKDDKQLVRYLCIEDRVNNKTPKAFIWHTFDDSGVNVKNSLVYATALKDNGIQCEVHLYQNGHHGMGLAQNSNSVGQWTTQLRNWLIHNDLMGGAK